MIDYRMLLNRCIHFVCQRLAFSCKFGILQHFGFDFSQLAQRNHSKHIRRNQETVLSGIVGRTERRDNQSHRLHRSTETAIDLRIGRTVAITHEAVRTEVVLTLLFLEGLYHQLHGFVPLGIKHRCIASKQPIIISHTNRVTQRVDFPLAFMKFLTHLLSIVGFPIATLRTIVECIGIRVEQDASCLTVNQTGNQGLQLLIPFHQDQVRPQLGR